MSLDKHFDNLLKVIAVEHENVGTPVSSIEIDLELPRGYVAKIKKVIIQVTGWTAAEGTLDWQELEAALIIDPDDAVTTQIPYNNVQHDVLCDFNASVTYDTTTGFGFFQTRDSIKKWTFENALFDVITARNIRFNALANATTGFFIKCTVYYTLEQIKSELILELLDIL